MIPYNRRNEIVREVGLGALKPNTGMHNGLCKLPYYFPIVSNGGNEIWIYGSNRNMGAKTVKFWISRGFFESPQVYFIYTNDPDNIEYYQDLIKRDPEHNWQIEEKCYRIMESPYKL